MLIVINGSMVQAVSMPHDPRYKSISWLYENENLRGSNKEKYVLSVNRTWKQEKACKCRFSSLMTENYFVITLRVISRQAWTVHNNISCVYVRMVHKSIRFECLWKSNQRRLLRWTLAINMLLSGNKNGRAVIIRRQWYHWRQMLLSFDVNVPLTSKDNNTHWRRKITTIGCVVDLVNSKL